MGLDTVELVLAVEDVFGMEIPDEVAQHLATVGALHEFVVAELIRLERPNVNRDIVYDVLRNLICMQLEVGQSRSPSAQGSFRTFMQTKLMLGLPPNAVPRRTTNNPVTSAALNLAPLLAAITLVAKSMAETRSTNSPNVPSGN
jgi:hypothetical protein